MNVILERTVLIAYYQFSAHGYANLGLHKCHFLLMICSLVRSFSFSDGLKEYIEFYICEKYSVSEVPNWEADLFWGREKNVTFLFLSTWKRG